MVKLHIPPYFSNKDHEIELLKKYPLSTMISIAQNEKEISKAPLLLKSDNKELYLEGHLSKANSHWKTIEKHQNVILIFNGSQGYISPNWYKDMIHNVPTWNYSIAVVEASCEIIHDTSEIIDSLNEMVCEFEQDNTWKNAVDMDFFNDLAQSIVGIKAKVLSIESKFKLSQNRNPEDKNNVLKYLKKINPSLADDMNTWGEISK
ncbi:MAG: FMN-binding negative transcriptional regulator [Bdellovibrionota bacterium]